jgi:hypothetical protein
MIGTAPINIQHQILGLCAKPNAIEISALADQAIAERMPDFSAPLGAIARARMVSIEIIPTMGK